MNAFVRALLIAAFAWSAGCGNNSGNQIPLSQCLSGWYLEPPSVACTPDTCGSSMPAPECGFKDCTGWGFEGFLPGGVYYFGSFLYSAQSMSMTATVIKQTWAAASDGYTLAGVQTMTVDSCTSTQMSAVNNIVTRPPANLAAALDQATSGGAGTFTRVAVAP